MCLTKVTSTTRDHKREGYGWKVFDVDRGGGLHSEFYHSGEPIKEGTWLKSVNNKSADYFLGFHIFRTRADARSWVSVPRECVSQLVRKVAWRDLLAEGEFGHVFDQTSRQLHPRRVTVAKEMLVLKEKKDA